VLLVVSLGTAQQAPGYRVSYRIAVTRVTADGPRTLAQGEISGSTETGVLLALRGERLEVETLFGIASDADSVTLTADFSTRRRLGDSRRGLPLWEHDGYRRVVRLAWGDSARVYPFGRSRRGRDSVWIGLQLQREPAGGQTRSAETIEIARDAGLEIAMEAVARPRRVLVVLNMVRGEAVSPPRRYDFVPGGPSHRMDFVVGGRPHPVVITMTRPGPSATARDGALAADAEVVCLRVVEPAAESDDATGIVCGRLNNVARRLPLQGGDTLVATFNWPGYR
jgi:hypothetical protein